MGLMEQSQREARIAELEAEVERLGGLLDEADNVLLDTRWWSAIELLEILAKRNQGKEGE